MTEIRYEEQEPTHPAMVNRILAWGDRLRLDYGEDEGDFVLYDGLAGITWHVSRQDRRLVGIVSTRAKYDWPKDWKMIQEKYPSGANVITRVHLNDRFCAEYKTAPMLLETARLMWALRQALAGNRARIWSQTPEDLRHPCALVVDVREAGIEYRDGMPLAVRYWDGRTRVYQGHESLPVRHELFALPEGYSRAWVGTPQGKAKARQPLPLQRR